MRSRRLVVPALLALVSACGEQGPPPLPQVSQAAPEPSEVTFQAVDAGTGGALTDPRMTVRYLVRSPITLDASGVESVPAAEPFRIAQSVGTDSLVVEVRVEAPSYHRMDTVLAVARGASAGPYTVRMARRLDREAAAPVTRPSGGVSESRPAAAGGAQPEAAPAGGEGVDQTALQEGNRAFQAGDWVRASMAYERMPEPPNRTGVYAKAYQAALVRKGIAHLNLSEFGGAMEAFEGATALPDAPAGAYLRLGQAQCAVGRTEAGRETLTRMERRVPALPAGEGPVAGAMIDYFRGLCSQGQVDLARTTVDLVRAGGQAVRELESFIQKAEALPRPPAEVTEAVQDARRRIEVIRAKVRRGAGDDGPGAA
jgi:hypothetical protein